MIIWLNSLSGKTNWLDCNLIKFLVIFLWTNNNKRVFTVHDGSNPFSAFAVHSVSWTISPNENLSENGNAGCFFCLFPNLVSLVADLFGGSWKKLFPVEKFGGPIPPIAFGPNLESYKKAVGLSRGFDVPAYKKRHQEKYGG